jgi:NADPH:quinone reductase-like Zn-dependent oxidoreductase
LAERRQIRPVIDSVYDLADIAAAHQRIEAGGMKGKIVVRIP